MSVIDKVLIAANQIENEGKQPSLALIKARTGGAISMPILIQGLQAYRDLPSLDKQRLATAVTKTPEQSKPSREDYLHRIEKLEQQVQQLSIKNERLEKAVDQLLRGEENNVCL